MPSFDKMQPFDINITVVLEQLILAFALAVHGKLLPAIHA